MKAKKLIALGLLFTLVFSTACGKEASNTIAEISESDLDSPQVTTVSRGDIEVYTAKDAWVEPYVDQLYFEDEGTFGSLKVQVGDHVSKGDVLVTLNMEDTLDEIDNLKQEINDLTTNYNYDKATLDNDYKIAKIHYDAAIKDVNFYADNKMTDDAKFTAACVKAGNYDSEMRRIELKLKQLKETYDLELPHAKSSLLKLQSKVNKSKLTAPYDGVIVAVASVEANEHVSKDKYYVAIADESRYVVRCESTGTALVKASLHVDFMINGETYETTYLPRSDKYTKEMRNSSETPYDEFEIDNSDGALSFSDTGTVLYVTKEAEDVLRIPVNTYRTSGGTSYVYLDVDGKMVKTNVTLGMKNQLYAEVVDGLEEGDVIYVQE